jgi:hypothetical protein
MVVKMKSLKKKMSKSTSTKKNIVKKSKVSKKRYTGRRKYLSNGKKIKKTRNVKNMKKIMGGGDPCEYVKVEGVTLPELTIPDQLAKLNNDCNSVTTPTGSPSAEHPNIGN